MHYRDIIKANYDPAYETLYIDGFFAACRKRNGGRSKFRVTGYEIREISGFSEKCGTHYARFYDKKTMYKTSYTWKFEWYFVPGTPREEMIRQAEAVLDLLKIAGENLHETA